MHAQLRTRGRGAAQSVACRAAADRGRPRRRWSVHPIRASAVVRLGRRVRGSGGGLPLWVAHVYDPNPQAPTRSPRVNIASPVPPSLPETAWDSPFRPVEFDGQTVTRTYSTGAGWATP
jgi:hypothetical protein